MQIIVDRESKVSPYIFPDDAKIFFADSGLVTPGFTAGDIKPDTHEILFGPAPDFFVGNALTFDGVWEVIDPAALAPHIQEQIVTLTQKRLDDFAKTRNYDGILSACTYATDLNPKFASEGQYCVEARSATWTRLYEMLAEVEAGTRPMPTGYADIEPELPPLVWPDEAPTA
jgi:hypothetical protein